MAEYIERTNALAIVDLHHGARQAYHKIRNLPAAEVAPIVEATILGNEMDERWCAFGKCSNCGEKIPTFSKFCLECGARMDGE